MMASDVRVILYGHAMCPGTARAKAYLSRQRVPHCVRDIGDAAAAAEFHALGALATPAVVLDGTLLMVGFDEEAFEAALAKAGMGGADPES